MPNAPESLNPGPRRARSLSLCRCLCWTIITPLLCYATWATIGYGSSVIKEVRFPHKALYYTGRGHETSGIIRPLIPDEQTFDIAVTVWLRLPEHESAKLRHPRTLPVTTKEAAAPAFSPTDLDEQLGRVWNGLTSSEENARRDEDILEKPVFSDIVFRELRLSDKHASAVVKFQLPTARFLDDGLAESDLRATFMLIPSSPSLIDYVKNFSSWMPDSVFPKRRPTRSWPFPLGSEDRGEKTMADLALESFSISVPLLEFHSASRQCTKSSRIGDGSDEDLSPPVEGHPYVVTRTQLRIVRETALFDAQEYNTVRNEIKRHSCGQGIPIIKPNLNMCRRSYKSNGNFETLLELEVLTESGIESQWAYAPYLDTKENSAGSLDIIPVPVLRENCTSASESTKDHMDVSWRIAFSGRTPAKQVLADNLVSSQPFDHRASDLMKVSQQNTAELWNGATGHRFHNDAHPRRRIGIQVVSGTCTAIAFFLLFHYWWSRVSTVGISISFVVFMVLAASLGSFVDTLRDPDSTAIFNVPVALAVPYLMCKCITRVQFGWRRWHPTITQVPANHLERASQRVDARTSWKTKMSVLFGLTFLYHFMNPDGISLLKTTVPPPRPGEYGPWADNKFLDFLQTITICMNITGFLSQFLLNRRSGRYGGGYRAEVVLFCLGSIINLLYFVPAVVGRMELRMGLTLKPLLDIAMHLPLLWQALTLPPVEVNGEDED